MNQRTSRPTYLYVIGAPKSTTVKIGMTTDLEARLQQIQRMCPVKLETLWARPAPYALERALHQHFAAYRSHGEWFTFESDPLPEIQSAVDDCMDFPVAEDSATELPESELADVSSGPEMPIRERLILDGLRKSFAGTWFSIEEASKHLMFEETSMRDGLQSLAELGKVISAPERLNWRKRQYALVVGSRS